jgi:hypothetical protein
MFVCFLLFGRLRIGGPGRQRLSGQAKTAKNDNVEAPAMPDVEHGQGTRLSCLRALRREYLN